MLKFSLIVFGLMLIFTGKSQAGEESLYDFLWLDPDKKVYVLQNKLYKKEYSWYADVGYISNFTSKFQDTQGLALRTGYYIHEEWGIELFYNHYANRNNTDYRNVRNASNVEPFIRKMESSYGALAIWSPFYGKINTFNQIFYFDWSFGAGLAKINASSNVKNVGITNQDSEFNDESYTGTILKTKVMFHLKENIHVGVEYMNTYYLAPGPTNVAGKVGEDKLRTNTDIILSVGFSF